MENKHGINFKNISFFNGLSIKEMEFIFPYMEEREFTKGEVLLAQGSRGGDLYLLVSGQVAVDIVLPGDYQKRLATLGSNEVFGEVTFLSDTLVTASVVALKPCICIVFYHSLLEMLRTTNPEIAYKIEKEIAHQTANKITSNISNIIKILNTLPKDFQSVYDHEVNIENPYTYTKELNVNDLALNHIKKLGFFNQVSQNEILKLLSLMKAKNYGRGYRFLANDKNINKIGLVYSGAVMLFIKENNKLIKPIAVSGVGELFLQNFIFPEFRQFADYVTCEKSIILELDMDVYQNLHQSNPTFFYIISEAIYRAIAGSVYITNRQFLRINSEYDNLISLGH